MAAEAIRHMVSLFTSVLKYLLPSVKTDLNSEAIFRKYGELIKSIKFATVRIFQFSVNIFTTFHEVYNVSMSTLSQ